MAAERVCAVCSETKRRIETLREDGALDAELARKLLSAWEEAPHEEAPPDPHVAVTTAFFGEVSARWARVVHSIESDTPKVVEHEVDAPRVVEPEPGVETLAELDDDAHADPKKPLGALGVFWFIGTILVLAGSVMGVREAWRSLEGVFRPLAIAGAFFGYHVLFVALARVLAKRSVTTGRVLTGIAAGILPVVFVASAVAIGQARSIGLPFAALFALGAMGSMAYSGRASFGPRGGLALAAGLGPFLGLELLIGTGGVSEELRLGGALATLVPLVGGALLVRRRPDATSAIGIAGAVYGAVAVAALALYGGPGDELLALGVDVAADRVVIALVAGVATCAWLATSGAAFAARFPRRGAVAPLLAMAALVSAAFAALLVLLGTPSAPAWTDPLLVVVLVVATAALVREQAARPNALHLAIPAGVATVFAIARLAFGAARPEMALAACALVPAATLSLGRRPAARVWGLAGGAALLAILAAIEPNGFVWTSRVALALALAAHAGGRLVRPSLHLAGGSFAFVAALVYAVPSRPEPWSVTVVVVAAALAVAYGVVGLVHGRLAASDDERRPFDDVSLGLVVVGGAVGAATVPSWTPSWVSNVEVRAPSFDLVAALPLLAIALVAFLRAMRDKSALVVTLGAFALAAAMHRGVGPLSPGQGALLAGLLGLAFVVVASLRAKADDTPRFGRAVFGLIPLPFGGRGRGLLDGFGIAAICLGSLVCARAAAWLGPRPEIDRGLVVLGLVAVVVMVLAGFATRGLEVVRARGHVATLAVGLVVIALAAVANRLGRPLPPAVVGWKITVGIAAVWLLACGLARVGPRIGAALGRPDHGRLYAWVPLSGVIGLGALLLLDAFLVGAPTPTRALAVVPPLFLFGAALAMVLVARSAREPSLLYAGLVTALGGAALAVAQRGVLGVALVPLDPPGGRWVPEATATDAARDWLDPGRFLVGTELALWQRAFEGLALATVTFAALLLLVRSDVVARVLRRVFFSPTSTLVESVQDAHVARALGTAVLVGSGIGVVGLANPATWSSSPMVAVLLATFAATTALAAHAWRVSVLAAAPPLVLALAGLAGVAFVGDAADLTALFGREGALAACALAAAAAAAHGLGFVAAPAGPRVARDVLLVAAGLAVAFFVAVGVPNGHWVGVAGVGALSLGILVSLHAAVAEHTGRHVMFVEALLVALYAFVTRAMGWAPEVHAVVGLGYGFMLVGVSVVARRRGIVPVADATRRFVTALPILLVLATTNDADHRTAALALGVSGLYGAIAWLEKSRIYGSLAAFAINAALLVFALAQGFDGIEVYVGPVGLFVLALTQIFVSKTSHESRTLLRIVGGALLYLPTAVKLTSQLGEASSGTTSVVFGALCLFGVVVGVTLRVRAYLALGTIFLTLDVLANLVNAGLRDHRVGFVLLSTAGLAILGAMILLTLRRELAWAAATRFRLRLRAWD